MDPREMVEVAERLIEDWHLLEEAAQVLRWATEIDGSEPIRRRLAEVLVKLGRDEEARKILAELEPSDDPAELNVRALAQAGAFEHEKAVATLDRAIGLDPKRDILYANRGIVHFQRGDYESAAADLVRSAVVGLFSPLTFRYPHEPGVGDFESLLNGYAKIREEARGHDAAFAVIDVWVSLVNEKVGAAVAGLAKLERTSPSWMLPALRLVALGLRERFEYSPRRQAAQLKLLREAVARQPSEIALLLRLEDSLPYDADERLELTERFTLLLPRWVEGHTAAAAARRHRGDLPAALAHADRAVALDGEDWSALRERSLVREGLGDLEGALRDLDTVAEIYGAEDEEPIAADDWTAQSFRQDLNLLLCSRADLKLELRDLEGARRDYDLAVRLSPEDDWLVRIYRAEFLAKIKDRHAAIADLEHALSQRDAWMLPKALRLLSRLKLKTGDVEGAQQARAQADEIVRQHEARARREARNDARRRARKKAARSSKTTAKKNGSQEKKKRKRR